ncbi:hypothetical protein, partial [Streptomyces sp. H34-S4]|uniref:hypothetical protein n=1 Tax=Streptomyces sp. H34-S4 TaxID=2996463 RepID=UPI00226EC935
GALMPFSRRLLRPLGVALLPLALAGCGGSAPAGGPAGEEPPIGATPTLLASGDLRFPLDVYIPSGEQNSQLAKAQDRLVDQCMQRYGFRYESPRAGSAAQPRDESRRYGLSDAAVATRYGYNNPVLENRPPKPAPKQLGPNEKLFLNGEEQVDPAKPVPMSQEESEKSGLGSLTVDGKKVPSGGCMRESFLKLYAPVKNSVDVMVPQNFGFDAYGRSRQDTRVEKAIKEWSACMAEKGYRTDDPVSPELGFNDATLGSPQAVTAAQQDVACKARTNLVGIWHTVEVAYQKRLIEQNAEVLTLAKTQLEERMRLAAQLTSA